jgi:DivIVA domain-containing protein
MPGLSIDDFSRCVRQVRFRHRLFGYHPGQVDEHLKAVSGWFSLAGLDELLEKRARELEDQAEQRLADAHEEASHILADARRDAAEMRAAAQEDAHAILQRERREAALERRGRSRVGRPLGGRPNGR